MRLPVLTFALLGFTLLPAVPAVAQAEKMPEQVTEKVAEKQVNPHIAVMTERAKGLAESLNPAEVDALGQIRENFGYIRSISVAQSSVENAVNQCADQNPDMKADITEKFAKWNGDIAAVLDKQAKQLADAVSEKNFKDPAEVQAYLDAIDDMADYSESHLDKSVVTTPEACQNLISSMDETKKVILDLITDLTWPGAADAPAAEEDGAAAP